MLLAMLSRVYDAVRETPPAYLAEAMALQSRVDEAIEMFQRAVTVDMVGR